MSHPDYCTLVRYIRIFSESIAVELAAQYLKNYHEIKCEKIPSKVP